MSTGKDKTLKELENDIAALETRIRNLDTGVTTTYTDDNIHGDTPTPTRQLSIVSQTHEGVSESCSQLLKKLDIVQIGFVQIQSQNKHMVKLVQVVNAHVLILYLFGDSIVHFVENLSISILETLDFFIYCNSLWSCCSVIVKERLLLVFRWVWILFIYFLFLI